MKNKTIGIIICLMLFSFSITPLTTAIEYNVSLKSDADEQPLMIGIVFGFFPQVSDDEVTFLSFPSMQWGTLPLEEFQGYIGIFIIYGRTGYPN